MSSPLFTNDIDYAEMARALDAHPDFRVLRRLPARQHFAAPDGPPLSRAVVIDTETTGLQTGRDRIIELAMVAFEYDAATGEVFRVLGRLSTLEDPGMPIPAASTEVHGITDAMVQGERIDDEAVATFLDACDLVIAHNTRFDRPFLEARLPHFATLSWACSLHQVDWQEDGIGSGKLEYIASQHGFFYDAHRAMNDCEALLEVLQAPLPATGQRLLEHLAARAAATDYRLWARRSPFETQDVLKARGYRWEANERCWYADMAADRFDDELGWLRHHVYGNTRATPELEEMDATVRFSGRRGVIATR